MRASPLLRAVPILLLLAAGCGDDDGEVGRDGGAADAAATGDAAPPDAAVPPDYACLTSPPTSAPDPIEVGGLLAAEGTPAGATIELRRSDDDGLVAETTSDDGGHFTLSVPTGGLPVNAYLLIDADGAMPLRRAWAGPFAADVAALGVAAWTDESINQTAANVGITQQAGRGVLIMTLRDCGGALVVGATVTLSPSPGSAQLYYAGYQQPFCWPYTGYTVTTDCGMVWAFNVPAGEYTATVEWGGDPVAELPVTVAAGAVSVASTDLPR